MIIILTYFACPACGVAATSGGLGGGTLAGIILGVVLLLGMVALAACLLRRRSGASSGTSL